MELLRTWLNDDLGLSRPVDSFEADFANGYLIGEVLLRHGLLPNADSLADKSTPMAMVTNFNLLQQPLLDLGVDFSSKVANAIMTEKKNVATNLCYQLKLGLENCVQSGSAPVHRRGMKDPVLLASTIKPNRAPLQRFEAMQSEHFESLVRQAAKSEKELAEALSLSRYTEFMVEATRRADELDSLTHEQHEAHVSQRRQLQLQKMSEGRRLVGEWQAEGYAKHRANMGRRKATEQAALRFELTQRERKLGRELGATKKAAGEFTSGVDEFEATLKRLASDGGGGGDGDDGGAPPPMEGMDAAAADHLSRLARTLPDARAMEHEASNYMAKLRGRRQEEQASRKEREVRRRRVMLEQAQAQAQLDEKRREEILLNKLNRQCAEERRIAAQLYQTRREKEVMKANRELREAQCAPPPRPPLRPAERPPSAPPVLTPFPLPSQVRGAPRAGHARPHRPRPRARRPRAHRVPGEPRA